MASHDLQAPVPTTERIAEEARTPTLLSPPESKTPPTATHKRNQTDFAFDRNSEPVDASALTKALEQFEQAGRVREAPMASPSRKRQRLYGDRCVLQFVLDRAGWLTQSQVHSKPCRARSSGELLPSARGRLACYPVAERKADSAQ